MIFIDPCRVLYTQVSSIIVCVFTHTNLLYTTCLCIFLYMYFYVRISRDPFPDNVLLHEIQRYSLFLVFCVIWYTLYQYLLLNSTCRSLALHLLHHKLLHQKQPGKDRSCSSTQITHHTLTIHPHCGASTLVHAHGRIALKSITH